MKHALYAVVVALEYEIQPAQKVAVLSNNTASPKTFKVTLGLGAYVPFDGRRLRLSTGRDAQNVSYCEIELNADDTCREVSRSFVFPPSSTGEGQSAMSATGTGDFDTQTLQQYAWKVVRFCLLGPARSQEGQRSPFTDETPDRASDDSSDVESVVDDEDLGEEGDVGLSSEEEDSIAPLPKKKKKKSKKSKQREESSSEEEDEDDTSTLSRSVVSGTSRRSELRPQRHRKKKKVRSRRDSSDDEADTSAAARAADGSRRSLRCRRRMVVLVVATIACVATAAHLNVDVVTLREWASRAGASFALV